MLVTAAAAAAHAAPAEWTCWLHRGEQLACMSVGEAAAPAAHAARSTPRELLQVIRTRPGALRGQTVYIPLYTVPFEDSRLEQLAVAVLCGAAPREPCAVSLARDAARLGPRARAAFSDANDPLLERR